MKAEYIQRGESIDYRNLGDLPIAAGEIMTLGSRIGVAGCDIPPGDLGSIHTVGVFSVIKANSADVFPVGADVFYSESGAALAGDIKMGWAVEPSASGAINVLVKI